MGTEIVSKVFDEPGPEGDCTIGFKPELGVEGEERITRFCVFLHDQVGSGAPMIFFTTIWLPSNVVSVLWVGSQKEYESGVHSMENRIVTFFIIPEGDSVRPSQLAEAQETGESGVELGVEQEVVVDGGLGEGVRNSEQVCDGEWSFSLCGSAVVVFWAGQSMIDEGSLSVEVDVGEVRLQLAAYSGEV